MKAVARALGVARSSLVAKPDAVRRRGRHPLPEAELVAEIKAVIATMPTYGYRRVHAILRRRAEEGGRPSPNHKRVWRVMKAHGLLLARHAGGAERRHDGRIAVPERNTRWCSDGFEIACGNGERVRVAFALDCCDREAMSFVGTTGGISGDGVRDLVVAALEHRFGRVNRLPWPIEWLSDNGSPYVARETRVFARDIGLVPRTTPLESPQSNGARAHRPAWSPSRKSSIRTELGFACAVTCAQRWRVRHGGRQATSRRRSIRSAGRFRVVCAAGEMAETCAVHRHGEEAEPYDASRRGRFYRSAFFPT